jgi:hypothetical protein
MKYLTPILCALGLASAAHADDPVLTEGDCWSYRSRPGEEASFLVIRKIEQIPGKGEVVHISIFGVHIKSPVAPGGFSDHVGHMPISAASLRKSLTQKLQKTAPDSDWQAGYASWKEAKGGVFTEPVSECVRFVEEALNRGHAKA